MRRSAVTRMNPKHHWVDLFFRAGSHDMVGTRKVILRAAVQIRSAPAIVAVFSQCLYTSSTHVDRSLDLRACTRVGIGSPRVLAPCLKNKAIGMEDRREEDGTDLPLGESP